MVNAESMKLNQEKNEMTSENHEPNVGREAEGSDQGHTPLKSTSHCEIEKLNNPANVKKIRSSRLIFDRTGRFSLNPPNGFISLLSYLASVFPCIFLIFPD